MHLDNFYNLSDLFLKLEGLNIAGSIKIKTAVSLLNNLEDLGVSPQKHKIIESSSGNLGIALSIVCKSRGYDFFCVVDPNVSPYSEKLMKVYGAKLIKVTKKDSEGGYLGTRIKTIEKMLKEDTSLIWTNQYASEANPLAHYQETAKEIIEEFSQVDYVFIGAGTTGTLVGCAKYIKKLSPKTKIIAIDSIGSVTFGFKASPRFIPGLGTSKRPPICNTQHVDEILLVSEKDAVKMCHFMLDKYGLFLGGSSGSVLEAIKTQIKKIPCNACVVALSPDFGDKYISTIYNPEWVQKTFKI